MFYKSCAFEMKDYLLGMVLSFTFLPNLGLGFLGPFLRLLCLATCVAKVLIALNMILRFTCHFVGIKQR